MTTSSALGTLLALLYLLLPSKAGMKELYVCLTSCGEGVSLGVMESPALCCRSGGSGYVAAGDHMPLDCLDCAAVGLDPLTPGLQQDELILADASGQEPDGVNGCGGDCGPNAVCVVAQSSLSCACVDGFRGTTLPVIPGSCLDVDECSEQLDNCSDDGVCVNAQGSFQCVCRLGYTGDGVVCTAVNECTAGKDDCHPQAECIDTTGGFECVCRSGFTGDGRNCQAIVNECEMALDDCHPLAQCTDTEESFQCVCSVGYQGDGRSCEDIDECESEMDSCDRRTYIRFTRHGLQYSRRGVCRNTQGGFTCSCSPGLRLSSESRCIDVDECQSEQLNDCHANALCSNLLGTYYCVCRHGYSGDGVHCCMKERRGRSLERDLDEDNTHKHSKTKSRGKARSPKSRNRGKSRKSKSKNQRGKNSKSKKRRGHKGRKTGRHRSHGHRIPRPQTC